ncbi:4722_t:CDS:1, partial [Scutellospora calospora]
VVVVLVCNDYSDICGDCGHCCLSKEVNNEKQEIRTKKRLK